jgi:UDP-N-acetylmuramyl tripeptide synthase
MPGSIGLKLDPNSLKKLKFNGPVILVTGTNGKTSTANMIADTFEHAGYKVVTNRKGDNLREGIATALLSKASLSGRMDADAVILEIDELNVRHILPVLPVSAFVVNNFFRDQLDRAREMEQLIASIESVLPDYKGKLILNGNDPNVLRLQNKAPQAEVITFGLAKNDYSADECAEAAEGKFCPVCGHRLEYNYYQYSHIGDFFCPNCHFKTPKLDVCLENANPQDQTFRVDGQKFKGPYEGMYSIYNYAALLAAAKAFNLPLDAVRETFAKAPQPFGRNEKFENGTKTVILNLIKNPTGANEVMKVIEKDDRKKDIVIVLNDREQDGTDVSWIYDTLFEKIMNDSTQSIHCTGLRANDMALRLYYGGYQGDLQADESIEKALDAAKSDLVYVIATYTALLPARAAVVKKVNE